MDDRFIHTLQVSQWFNLWHSYQTIFQLATKIDFQYIVLFFAARIMIRFSQIHYKMDYSDICINHDGMNRRLWSIFYITHIMQWIKKLPNNIIDYSWTMNYHNYQRFSGCFPFSDETYHQLTQRVPQKCTAGVDSNVFHTRASEQKLHAATHFGYIMI